MDNSSLAVDGTFTYEHELATDENGKKINIKLPDQTVGKILKAKKIFSEKDCEDERERYFWDKVQTPYIYVMGELFDDYTDAARDLAGKFRYDADRMNQNERTVCNFSIEGAYIARQGIEVTRSVARKCTISVLPCNKAARAEMVPVKGSAKGDIDSLFKTETIEIELFKSEPKLFARTPEVSDMQKHADALGIEPMKKADVLPFKKPLTTAPGVATKPAPTAPAGAPPQPKLPGLTNNPGTAIGATKSGKQIMSHAKIHEYHGFGSQDHQDAAHLHHAAAQAATTPQMGRHHLDKMKLHLQASKTAELREGRFARGLAQKQAKMGLGKAETAGSGMAAPSQLTGGAALAKEDLQKGNAGTYEQKGVHLPPLSDKKGGTSVMGSHVRNPSSAGSGSKEMARRHAASNLKQLKEMPKPKLEKADWLARAEEEYAKWDKREEYRAFMKKRMPHLADGEIDAIGKTIALKKSVDAEASLSKLIKK
jgi:hypothetical protein